MSAEPTDPTPALLPVTQQDIDLANLCVPSALIFADEAEHIADARARAAQHIARHRLALAKPTDAGWRPIESAPKDGSEFLSYGGPDNVIGKAQPTRWLSPGPYTTENGKNAQGERRYQWPDGFYWAGYDGFVGPVSPELWTPMPTTPETSSSTKGE